MPDIVRVELLYSSRVNAKTCTFSYSIARFGWRNPMNPFHAPAGILFSRCGYLWMSL